MTYASLHRLARSNQLGPAEQSLRDLARDNIDEWDVGARLAKALNSAIKRSNGLLSSRWMQDHKAFGALITADDKAGLARRILESAAQAEMDVDPWQRSMLFAAVGDKADLYQCSSCSRRSAAPFGAPAGRCSGRGDRL